MPDIGEYFQIEGINIKNYSVTHLYSDRKNTETNKQLQPDILFPQHISGKIGFVQV